jgi:hypothetical protein
MARLGVWHARGAASGISWKRPKAFCREGCRGDSAVDSREFVTSTMAVAAGRTLSKADCLRSAS